MMSERERLIGNLTGLIVLHLSHIDDPVERESAIYAMLCTVKEGHSESFEKALLFLLKEGIVK